MVMLDQMRWSQVIASYRVNRQTKVCSIAAATQSLNSESDRLYCYSYQGQMCITILLVRSLTLAIISQARALSREASKSLASRRLRLSQAMVRSTTQRRGNG